VFEQPKDDIIIKRLENRYEDLGTDAVSMQLEMYL
jgi:hypothetical protein